MGDTGGDRFDGCVVALARALGHADRAAPFRWSTTGLLLPLERRSVEPIAARTGPAWPGTLARAGVSAAHQSSHHLLAKAAWSDEALLAAVRAQILPVVETRAPIEAWIVDDTGFAKKGRHSVGATRPYGGPPSRPPS